MGRTRFDGGAVLMTILVFGPLGTEVHIQGRRYEIVVLSAGRVSWRTKCSVCEKRTFVHTKPGQLPARNRCPDHIRTHRANIKTTDVTEDEALAIQERFPQGLMPASDMVPTVPVDGRGLIDPVAAHEQYVEDARRRMTPEHFKIPAGALETMRQVRDAIATEKPGAQPLSGGIRMSLGDEANTTIETHVGDPKLAEVIFPSKDEPPATSREALLAELAELSEPEAELGPEEQAEQMWLPRLKLYRDLKMWQPGWGPRPGQPGCEVPEHLLE